MIPTLKFKQLISRPLAKLSINQMLVVSHLVLVVILILGFSYTRYHSEWHRQVEYSATISKLTLTPHVPFISSSVAGINYANLTMPATKDILKSIDDLEYLEIIGESDYSGKQVHVSFFKRFEYLWRGNVRKSDLLETEKKLLDIGQQIEATPVDNTIRLKKLGFIQNRIQREHSALTESMSISGSIYIPWNKPDVNSEGYYLDEELCTLNVVLPLRNQNGGEVWAVFDASELTELQNSLISEIIAEAVIALAISILLISWVSHRIVSPLKSLATHMRSDNNDSKMDSLSVLDRSDEIGQLARAYQGLLAKLDRQMNILIARSDTDPLTGLGSRYKYTRTVLPFIKRHLAQNNYVGLIVCDVDNFKAFNDLYGHTAGDNALADVGSKIIECSRDSDLSFRYGGEEFVILCARPEVSQLIGFTERLRKEIEEMALSHEGNQPHGCLTLSIGGSMATQYDINERFNTHQELQESMFNVADKALYMGKQNGRNQVTWGSSLE